MKDSNPTFHSILDISPKISPNSRSIFNRTQSPIELDSFALRKIKKKKTPFFLSSTALFVRLSNTQHLSLSKSNPSDELFSSRAFPLGTITCAIRIYI